MNIGPKESSKRLIMGVAVLGLGVGATVALILTGVNRWWRLALLLPFWLGALGFFQAKEKT